MIVFKTPEIEFINLAQSLNGMSTLINDLELRVRFADDKTVFAEDFFILAYIARCGVQDRLDHFGWPIEREIMIPALDSEPILLGEALVHTIDWLPEIANTLGLKLEYNEIMHKGPAFYELQSVLPMDLRNNV